MQPPLVYLIYYVSTQAQTEVIKENNVATAAVNQVTRKDWEASEERDKNVTTATVHHVTRNVWGASTPQSQYLNGNLTLPVKRIIISHTADNGCNELASCINMLKIYQNYHITNKWGDIGFNFLIGGDGKVYDGRGWLQVGAHTRGCNFISIGISFIGTFTDVAPKEGQIKAFHELIEEGCALGILSKDYKLYAQQAFQATESPGKVLYEMMKKWPHFEEIYNPLCTLWK